MIVLDKTLQAVYEIGSVERVPPNADHSGLSKAGLGRLVYSLVCQSSRPGNKSYLAWLVDVSLHQNMHSLANLHHLLILAHKQLLSLYISETLKMTLKQS